MTIRLDPADMATCRALLKGGSRTFHAASKVLPRRVADPAIALYAFCRLADDAVDLGNDRAAAVARLQDRLNRAYRGQPMDLAADRVFADVVAKFSIPRELPEALLEGLAWDAQVRRYETLRDLTAYAARVAGAVGAMMTLVMGQRSPEIVARACDLGVAMQLTNIARDVGEDARAGRLYLPLSWLREAGIDPDVWLANPVFTPELAAIVQRLLDAADILYARATLGIANLPMGCRPGIYAARALYAEIGRELERGGLDSIARRAVVSTNRKLAVLARMLLLLETEWKPARKFGADTAQLEETRFLVDAVAATPLHQAVKTRSRPIEDRVVWVIDLFERLERRDQLQRSGSFR
ncbi:MAG: phytoene/squalene synthase family protein [Bradyrhizobium sp.]